MRTEHWPEIMAVQKAAYHEIEPESRSVMERKMELSPESCFTALADNRVAGYVLAHPWMSGKAPPLHERLTVIPATADSLYLHDLALLPEWRGQNAAAALCRAVLRAGRALGYRQSHLTAIQGSVPFWEKMGYRREPMPGHELGTYPAGACLMRQELF